MPSGRGNRPGDAEVARSVRHLTHLNAQHAGCGKRVIDVPARTGCAKARDVDARAAEALRDVSRDIDSDEMERHAFGVLPAQRRQPVTDLLETRAETMLEDIQIMARGTRRLAKTRIGHHDRRGEIVRQRGARELIGFFGRELALCGQTGDLAMPAEERDLMGELKAAAWERQHLGEAELSLQRPILAKGVRHRFDRQYRNVDGKLRCQNRDESLIEVVQRKVVLGPQLLRGEFEQVEVVAVLIDEIRNLFGRHPGRKFYEFSLGILVAHGGSTRLRVGAARRLIERKQRSAERRRQAHQFLQLGGLDPVHFEQRIGKRLHQIRQQAGLVVGIEQVDVDREALRELEQNRHGEWPLVVFEQIEIARADL